MPVDDHLIERLAEAIHERYLVEQTRDGVALGSSAAMTTWHSLDADTREANRDQARHIAVKLAKIGCSVAPIPMPPGASASTSPVDGASARSPVDGASARSPVDGASARSPVDGASARSPVDGAFAFSDDELDLLAREEHRRWGNQRTSAGWVYGPARDDAAKRHPSLVPWSELSESEKDKDRDAVRNIPAVLAAAGLRVVRGQLPRAASGSM